MHLKNGGSVGAGLHIANLLKPALARGVLQVWVGVKDPKLLEFKAPVCAIKHQNCYMQCSHSNH